MARGIEKHRKGRRIGLLAFGLLMAALTQGCMGERARSSVNAAVVGAVARSILQPQGPVSCGSQYLDALESSFSFSASSTTASETTGLELFFSTTPDPTLETYTLVATLPPEFTFLGFDALGGGAQVGQMAFDFNPNGIFENVDFSFDAFAVDADTAYADSFANFPPAYDVGVDPFATVSSGAGGETIVTITLPMGGGDGDLFGGDRDCSYFPGDMRFTLFDGLFQLPATPGDYTVDVVATSVDTDTGDFDDGSGFTPLVYQRQVVVAVPEPAPALGAAVALLVLALCRRRTRTDPVQCPGTGSEWQSTISLQAGCQTTSAP